MSTPTAPPGSTDGGEAIKLAGNVIMLNDRQGSSLINFKSNPLEFCLADEIILVSSAGGRLLLNATYWRFPSLPESPPQGSEKRCKKGVDSLIGSWLA